MNKKQLWDNIIYFVAGISAFLALASLATVVVYRLFLPDCCCLRLLGKIIVCFWVLAPPVWFWLEWWLLKDSIKTDDEREKMIHLHDVSRNIWIALVAVLTALFGINIFNPGGN